MSAINEIVTLPLTNQISNLIATDMNKTSPTNLRAFHVTER